MKIFKKNQIIISVIALMLITVGYMNYTNNVKNAVATGTLLDAEKMAGLGDAKLVNSNNVENAQNVGETSITNNEGLVSNEEDSENLVSNNEDGIENATVVENSSNQTQVKENDISILKQTSAEIQNSEYFANSKLERDKMYSQMVETYQKLLESSVVSAEQKTISTQEIAKINNIKNSIMIAENLIKNLGFENVVIFVNEGSVSVIVKAEKLEQSDVAQIQNIVCREIGVEVGSIHITHK